MTRITSEEFTADDDEIAAAEAKAKARAKAKANGAAKDDLTGIPLSVAEWMLRELPKPDYILGNWLTTTSRALMVAPTGVGKTMLGIGLGFGVSSGLGFLHWQGIRPARVLFIDGEMSRQLLKERMVAEVARLGGNIPDGMFFLSHDDVENFQPLSTQEGQATIETMIGRIGAVDLIIFDNIMSLVGGDMKDEEVWRQVMPWTLSLTRRQIGQVWAHHTGHDESRSYGTKTREWMMDTVLHLETVERNGIDVSFQLSFKKARERAPHNRADFIDAHIALLDDTWTTSAVSGWRKDKVSPLARKFFDALRDATIGCDLKMSGCPAASLDLWRDECIRHGIIDPKDRPDSARNLFNKYRRELIAANWIATNEASAWTL